MGGQALHHHRGGGLVVDRLGDLDEGLGPDRGEVGVAARVVEPRDPVARREVLDGGADGLDAARALHAHGGGQPPAGQRHRTRGDVHVVDAGDGDAHQRLARGRDRVGQLD